MIPRIFSEHNVNANGTVELRDGAAKHVTRVLRLHEGDELVVFDGSGIEFPARIESITRQAVTLSTGAGRNPGTESGLSITLLQGICRSQRMDLLIQKSTELGVAGIRPVSCTRSVVRLDETRSRKKSDHWRQIAISACEQSGRVVIPAITAPAPLEAAIESVRDTGLKLLLDPHARENLGETLDGEHGIALLIGPEGGLTDTERSMAGDAGFRPVRIGPRVLRTETAPLAALSILQYLAGDLN
ncbi:MAG: 16S rRNA (uracil(1498)-N(3))-methyltransferase [Gammaproteobacteria bacterium]